MRVIVTARQALAPNYVAVLGHLTKILGEISKNPSNPKFNHFTFESISALIRCDLSALLPVLRLADRPRQVHHRRKPGLARPL